MPIDEQGHSARLEQNTSTRAHARKIVYAPLPSKSAEPLEEAGGGRADQTFPAFEESGLSLYPIQGAHHRLLSDDEIAALGERIAAGTRTTEHAIHINEDAIRARNTLVVHNLRLSVNLALKYQGRGLPLADLIQEGSIGLIKAAEGFDHSLGNRFSTYAVFWVRSRILQAIYDKGTLIRIPAYLHETMSRVIDISMKAKARLGRIPTLEEVVAEGNDSANQVRKAIRLFKRLKTWTPSLDDPEDHSYREQSWGYLIDHTLRGSPDSRVLATEALAEAVRRVRNIKRALAAAPRLSLRDRQIFFSRYGLDGTFEIPTLQAAGAKHGVTKRRAWQIIERAWKKLRGLGVELDEGGLLRELGHIRLLEEFIGRRVKI
jgi:RNA polymerase primary sigma factor